MARAGKRTRTIGYDLNKMSQELRMAVLEAGMGVMEELAENIDRQCKMIREYGQRLKRRHDVEQNDEKKDGEQ